MLTIICILIVGVEPCYSDLTTIAKNSETYCINFYATTTNSTRRNTLYTRLMNGTTSFVLITEQKIARADITTSSNSYTVEVNVNTYDRLLWLNIIEFIRKHFETYKSSYTRFYLRSHICGHGNNPKTPCHDCDEWINYTK